MMTHERRGNYSRDPRPARYAEQLLVYTSLGNQQIWSLVRLKFPHADDVTRRWILYRRRQLNDTGERRRLRIGRAVRRQRLRKAAGE